MKNLNVKRARRFGASLLLAATLGSLSGIASAATQMMDRVIAIVDGDVILASELNNRIETTKSTLQQRGQQLPSDDILQRELLDRLIVESLQMQMADRAGIRISDAELNQAMARVAAQNQLSPEQFREELKKSGRSYLNVREEIRRELAIQRVQQGSVNRRIQISDQEIKSFLNSAEGAELTAPEFNVVHALIPLSSSATDAEQAKAADLAQQLSEKLRSGAKLDTLAGNQQGFTVTTGELGWRRTGDLPSIFGEVVPALSNGEVADPKRSASGFHIIKLVDSRGRAETIPQTKARHILLKASAIRTEAETEIEANKLRERIMSGESFADLARQYSEDIGSAMEGGDLGWTTPGQLVPAFQEAMDNTAAGEVSPAFRSRYGWHILEVEERRQKDVTEDLRRNMARNFLHQRKYKDELQVWLQKIRDEAYVDIK